MFTKWDIYVSDTEFKKLKNLTNKAKLRFSLEFPLIQKHR